MCIGSVIKERDGVYDIHIFIIMIFFLIFFAGLRPIFIGEQSKKHEIDLQSLR